MFNVGPFKGQQSFETGWFSVPERDVPVPRPGQASTVVYLYILPLLYTLSMHESVIILCDFSRITLAILTDPDKVLQAHVGLT